MNETLKEFSRNNGIRIGVCDAARMEYLIPLLEAAETPFTSRELDRRINPRAIMATAESVIVIGVEHGKIAAPPDDVPRGRIAAIAAARDYHRVVADQLHALAACLQQRRQESMGRTFAYRAFVDAGHLNERALAVRAGLGFIGRNGQVISKAFGSYFHIGYMLTDLVPGVDIPLTMRAAAGDEPGCDGCRRCVDACIGGALGGRYDGGFDVQKCVAYLTQRKQQPTEAEARAMGNWLYGCDVCQEVCPYNTQIVSSEQECSMALYPALTDCVEITDEAFAQRYGDSALAWRGAEVFRRNAAIARENSINLGKIGENRE